MNADQKDFIDHNTVSTTVVVADFGGDLIYRFKEPDGTHTCYNDPLPACRFEQMARWALKHDEVLEITIKRFPNKQKKIELGEL